MGVAESCSTHCASHNSSISLNCPLFQTSSIKRRSLALFCSVDIAEAPFFCFLLLLRSSSPQRQARIRRRFSAKHSSAVFFSGSAAGARDTGVVWAQVLKYTRDGEGKQQRSSKKW